jgi:hypothetical protein
MTEIPLMTTTISPQTIALRTDHPFDVAYRRLVDARLEYEMLRNAGAPLGTLAEARGVLHRARAEMAHQRRGLPI